MPIDEPLVRRLLSDQHPDLARLPLHLLDAGFDNVIWRLGDDLALRLPRREMAAALIEHEQTWLAVLHEQAPELPVDIPLPIRLGRPAHGYPWHWSVVPWIEGEPGDRVGPTDVGITARRMGQFLHTMHALSPDGLPSSPRRGGPVVTRTDTFEERMKRLTAHVDEDRLRSVWDDAVAAPHHGGRPAWLHGDLHPANLLVAGGVVVAVIDFGDTCAGDPACDLGAAWMTVPDEGWPHFWAAYGPVDPDLVRRSHGWSVLFGLMLLEIGLENRPTYATVGRAILRRMAGLA